MLPFPNGRIEMHRKHFVPPLLVHFWRRCRCRHGLWNHTQTNTGIRINPIIIIIVPNSQGFADFAKPTEFGTYVDYVIRPSYNLHKAMGLLKYTISGQELETEMSFRNFFSGRILWDEAMATRAFQWTDANPGGLMIGVVGADHVKFQDGIPGRYQRMAGSTRDCTSVLLNPTLIDTRPPGSVSSVPNSDSAENPDGITLQLRYVKDGVDRSSPDRYLPSNTGGVLPLADFIVIS